VPDDFIIVVTGLPRSGTTLMMRMLEAGGIPPYYDNSKPVFWTEEGVDYLNHNAILRETDKTNDQKFGDGSWLKECYGMAVKLLVPVKYTIPRDNKYRFIWCERKTKYITKSLIKYSKRKGQEMPPEDILRENLRAARTKWRKLFKSYPDSDFMEVRFEKVIKDPKVTIFRLEQFLGQTLDKERMASVVVKRPPSCMPFMMEERIYLNEGVDRRAL
jgi:hypothetical protein